MKHDLPSSPTDTKALVRKSSVGLARRVGEITQLTNRPVTVEHRDVDKPLLPPGAHRARIA